MTQTFIRGTPRETEPQRLGWAILDMGHVYIPRTWATREEAEAELEDLLAPFPPESLWRARIKIGEVRWIVTAVEMRRRRKVA